MADLGPVPGANMADLARCVRRDPSGDTEEMGILHVDSSLEAARAEAAKVLGYMAAEGFEVERVGTSGWAGRGWDEVFDENEIDIVLGRRLPRRGRRGRAVRPRRHTQEPADRRADVRPWRHQGQRPRGLFPVYGDPDARHPGVLGRGGGDDQDAPAEVERCHIPEGGWSSRR